MIYHLLHSNLDLFCFSKMKTWQKTNIFSSFSLIFFIFLYFLSTTELKSKLNFFLVISSPTPFQARRQGLQLTPLTPLPVHLCGPSIAWGRYCWIMNKWFIYTVGGYHSVCMLKQGLHEYLCVTARLSIERWSAFEFWGSGACSWKLGDIEILCLTWLSALLLYISWSIITSVKTQNNPLPPQLPSAVFFFLALDSST